MNRLPMKPHERQGQDGPGHLHGRTGKQPLEFRAEARFGLLGFHVLHDPGGRLGVLTAEHQNPEAKDVPNNDRSIRLSASTWPHAA